MIINLFNELIFEYIKIINEDDIFSDEYAIFTDISAEFIYIKDEITNIILN